jgi:hypothetical protein
MAWVLWVSQRMILAKVARFLIVAITFPIARGVNKKRHSLTHEIPFRQDSAELSHKRVMAARFFDYLQLCK